MQVGRSDNAGYPSPWPPMFSAFIASPEIGGQKGPAFALEACWAGMPPSGTRQAGNRVLGAFLGSFLSIQSTRMEFLGEDSGSWQPSIEPGDERGALRPSGVRVFWESYVRLPVNQIVPGLSRYRISLTDIVTQG